MPETDERKCTELERLYREHAQRDLTPEEKAAFWQLLDAAKPGSSKCDYPECREKAICGLRRCHGHAAYEFMRRR